MAITRGELSSLVDPEKGRVARRIFVDEELYQLELDRIFGRCWLYLAHESQIREPGDFVKAFMGEDEVIVSRGQDGKVRAFLNSCSHRGAKPCRAAEGNARTFRCPYHGWTFGSDGALVSVPRSKTVYGEGTLNRDELGLRQVTQVDSIGGLIFGTWDPAAPSLADYLGDMALYLDLMVNRTEGGLEVIGGAHRWVIDVNWKIPSENFGGDYYHLPTTHGSGIELGFRNPVTNDGYSMNFGIGHGFGAERGGAQQGTTAQSAYTEFIEGMRSRVAETRGEGYNQFVPIGVGNLFPNLSFMDTVRFRSLRLWHPRGPGQIEVVSWCLLDADLPEELKEATRQQYTLAFGPSGMFEQDDGDVWTGIQASLRGTVGRQGSFNYQAGLGREIPVATRYGEAFPGTMGDTLITEANQRDFYRRWQRQMLDDAHPGAVDEVGEDAAARQPMTKGSVR